MALFNVLAHPVWVFDIEKKAMWWANTAALSLWNADSLDSLLSRSFADDMSEATSRRLADYLCRFREGERITDQWTYYPSGRGPTTVHVTETGMYIEEGRLVMLNEADLSTVKEGIDEESLRGVELLRHLPIAVCQFDCDGNIMHQNPEALDVFGSYDANIKVESRCDFLSRFVDKDLGKQVLSEVQSGNDFCVEAQQHTKLLPRWFAIKVRRSKDPVTMDPVILYSARDITEVIEAKKEADQANMEQAEFMAVMGHEIRTPLHQVIGFIELLGQTNLNDEQANFVNILQGSASSLMTVINDLLDYSKLEAGKMKLEAIPFESKAVVDGSLSAIRPKADAKGLRVESNVRDRIPVKLLGDPNRLRQILLNFLHNAVKFTHQGTISLTVSRVHNDQRERIMLRFVVADSGVGICREHQQHIFKKYRQADESVARRYGGTGLGLAICKSLVEAMGGSIGVESEVGEGSKFWFEVPFELPTNKMEEIDFHNLVVATSGLHVLVAEDNKVNQKLITSMLQRDGHLVTVVENGKQAVEEVKKSEFDLVLMDVQMPVMDGIDATKHIRSIGWTKSKLPVIGLTASFQTSERQYYKDLGMNDCIGKPVRMKTLRAAISERRRRNSLQRQNSLVTPCA